jgi:hypothetical protein
VELAALDNNLASSSEEKWKGEVDTDRNGKISDAEVKALLDKRKSAHETRQNADHHECIDRHRMHMSRPGFCIRQ